MCLTRFQSVQVLVEGQKKQNTTCMYFIHNFVRNLTRFNNLFAHEVVFLLFCPLFAFKRGDRD